MGFKRQCRAKVETAFSLVEVVIAVGVAAVSIVGVVALYRPVVQAVSEVREIDAAERTVNAIESAWHPRGFSEVVDAVETGRRYFASRSGDLIGTTDDPVWNVLGPTVQERDAGKAYEFVFLRNGVLSPPGALHPGSVVVTLHLAWPAYRADGTRVADPAHQNHRLVPLAFAR